MPSRIWSQAEVDAIIADYFAMLRDELLGNDYSKAEHRNALLPNLDGRTQGSVEYKHQNISAVMLEMGLPYVNGYKPAGNYQRLLAESIQAFLDNHPSFFVDLEDAPGINPPRPRTNAPPMASRVFDTPPDQIIVPGQHSKPWITRKVRPIDFSARDARNRRLGGFGEQFVVSVEKQRLTDAGREDLAANVEWVASTIGDGLGFDVLSFNEIDESERFIEVKATALGKYFPFYVTSTELRCSEDVPERFNLYRVFDLSRSPRIYVLTGALSISCCLEPIQYRATLGTGDSDA